MSNVNHKNIARNSLMLYFRMLLSMIVTLYTSRVVLNTLGIEDFGIYNVVGGVIVMLGFLNNAMTASTQRFLTFEIGKNDLAQLKKVFNMSITIHALIALLVLILAETIGLWFLNSYMKIPAHRLYAANWVYQFSVFSFIITVLSVPYNAAIIANEKMRIFAMVGILEVILKLAIVFLLVFFAYDKLILYAFLLLLVALIIRIVYGVYCKRNFEESRNYQFVWDKELFATMGNFASWNLLGVAAGVGYGQGVNILLNIFFGPIVNAARGIAFQVQSAINSFVVNFQIAVNPSIIKFHAREEQQSTFNLVFGASKFSFYLLLLLSMPLLIETEIVLHWWLKTVPIYTIIFTRLVLIDALVASISGSLHILTEATGNIKRYQFIVSGILLLNLPTSYMFLKLGYSAEITMIISIAYTALALIMRLLILKDLVKFPVKDFLLGVVLRILLVAGIALIIPLMVYHLMQPSILKFFTITLISSVSIVLSILLLGLNQLERQFLKDNYLIYLNKINS